MAKYILLKKVWQNIYFYIRSKLKSVAKYILLYMK